MISEFFLNIVFTLVEWLLSPLPEIDISLNYDATTYFFSIVRSVLYLLPVNTIISIISIIIALGLFRIFIAIVKTIWDLLPLV